MYRLPRIAETTIFCFLSATVVAGTLFFFREPVDFSTELEEEKRLICMPVIKSEELSFISSRQEKVSMEVSLYEAKADTGRETALPSRGERSYSEAIEGLASWYGGSDGLDGLYTASGERFDASAYTAAHRTLPFGTLVRVTYLKTGRSVIVRINDRGPAHAGRVIDLSRAAAAEIGLLPHGVGMVQLEILP